MIGVVQDKNGGMVTSLSAQSLNGALKVNWEFWLSSCSLVPKRLVCLAGLAPGWYLGVLTLIGFHGDEFMLGTEYGRCTSSTICSFVRLKTQRFKHDCPTRGVVTQLV